jgi:hypothetical protein
MKRVLFVAATAGLLASSHAETVWPDASQLPSHNEPPELLSMLDGKKITTPEQWFEQRRPELKELFQHYMYGWFPPAVDVHGMVTYTDAHFFAGKATLKLVTLKLAGEGMGIGTIHRRGYAVATYYCGDVEPDKTNATGGVRETIHRPPRPMIGEPSPPGPGACSGRWITW